MYFNVLFYVMLYKTLDDSMSIVSLCTTENPERLFGQKKNPQYR